MLQLSLHLAPSACQHLHRQEEAKVEALNQLGAVDHHHETLSAASHQLLLHVASTTPFDQFKSGIHLISAINGQINPIDGIEGLQRDPQFGRENLALK